VARLVPRTYHGRTAHEWAMRYKHRTRQYQHARHTLLTSPHVVEAINLACATYGNCSTLWRKADCETGGTYSPRSLNASSSASGLFQFLPSTWRTTPYGRFSVFSPYANALAAGWMHARGRGGEWECR
jgi:SLT domain-containing protein